MVKAVKKRFASIFSGCGGLDLGFTMAGFRCDLAIDIDPLAINVHRRNLKSTAVVSDLRNGSVPLDALCDLDVLLAGSPCQGFSIAGKRLFNDPRNHLLLKAGHIAILTKPKVFIVENVPGVTALPHRHYWETLSQMLRESGYQTTELICEGTRLGVPQLRKRIVLVAWATGVHKELVIRNVPGGTLGDALRDLKGKPNHEVKHIPVNSDLFRIAKRIKHGQKLSNVRAGS